MQPFPAWSPELADRALLRKVNLTVPDLLIKSRAGTEVKVRIQVLMVVMLHAIVFVAQAIV